MSNVDEASGSVGANADSARELAGGINSSKDLLDQLASQLSAVGVDAESARSRAASDRAEELAGHANALADALDSLRAQVDALKALLVRAVRGRAGPSQSSLPSSMHRGSDFTRPSHPPNPDRRPSGSPTQMGSRGKRRLRGDLQSENDAATALARSGYEIEQNPPPRPNGKKPDYWMEGDYWDCYTVRSSKVERVRNSIKDKVKGKDGKMQADRIVLNFDADPVGTPSTVTSKAIENLLQRKPVKGLKEVKVIEDGRIRNLDLGGR